MKKYIFLLSLSFFCISVFSQNIIRIRSIQEIFNHLNEIPNEKSILFMVNSDKTTSAFPLITHSLNKKKMEQVLLEAKEKFQDKWDLVKAKYEEALWESDELLIEKGFKELFNFVNNKEWLFFYLTGRRTGMVKVFSKESILQKTLRFLKENDLVIKRDEFKDISIDLNNIIALDSHCNDKKSKFYNNGTPYMVGNHIFTCNDSKTKYLKEVISLLKLEVRKIIYVDDDLAVHEEFALWCEQNNIEYLGFHYLGYEDMNKNIDEGIFILQKQYYLNNGVWLNEEQIQKNYF